MSSQERRWPGCFTVSTAYNTAKIHLTPFSYVCSLMTDLWCGQQLSTLIAQFFEVSRFIGCSVSSLLLLLPQKQKTTGSIPRGNIKICLFGLHIFSIKRFQSASGMYMNKNHFAYKSCYFHTKYIFFPIFWVVLTQ